MPPEVEVEVGRCDVAVEFKLVADAGDGAEVEVEIDVLGVDVEFGVVVAEGAALLTGGAGPPQFFPAS